MIIPDANLIIYAHNQADPEHAGEGHLASLLQCLRSVGVGGALTTDAHIAALAIEYRAEVHTSDLDFGRFPGVRWRNPLAV